MFRIEMLPAAHGDCIWIEYGTSHQVHRILIDGGPAHTYPVLRERILHLPADDRRFDLLVVTHIDADHIEGIMRLLQDSHALGCNFDRIWFNGRDQLNKVPDTAGEALGAMQGEMLGMLIADYQERCGDPVWNAGLPGGLAAVDRDVAALPMVDLPGDCKLTLLSPDHDRLLDLKDHWDTELHKAGMLSGDVEALRSKLEDNRHLRPLGDVLGEEEEHEEGRFELPDAAGRDLFRELGDALGSGDAESSEDSAFGDDGSKANGSSIALLLDYPKEDPQVRFLLSGDAWPSVLEASVDKLLTNAGAKLSLTGFKIPHHGSVGNLTESLLGKLKCRHYLVSTSGAVFGHPHRRAVELLLAEHNHRGKPRLHFNYLTETTAAWSDPKDAQARRYEAFHPKGISLLL